MTVNSAKRASSTTKMDVFVPSPGICGPFTTSPSSIYEQERSDLGNFCTSSSVSNPSADSVISDDFYVLDDQLEDSPLETLLTQDVMNTLQSTALHTASDFTWGGKCDSDSSLPPTVENLGSNPTLAQLNMEPDMSFINLLNMDQDDSKWNNTALDYMCSDVTNLGSQSNFSNFSTVSTGSSSTVVTSTTDSKRCSETVSSSSMEPEKKQFSDLENSYIKNIAAVKNNFPPRTAQPSLVGVVSPVTKQEPEESAMYPEKMDGGLGKLKAQSPNLHKLLSKQLIKTEVNQPEVIMKKTATAGNTYSDNMSAQIVPSSGAIKRTHASTFKTEPLSPQPVQKVLVKEESTEDKWKDIEHFMHSPGHEPDVKKRRRHDSGSSGHMSDEDEEEDDGSLYGGKDGEDDSDDDYSDIDDDLAHITPSNCESLVAMGKKQKQYFWQYNVQSKGPKGTRLKLAVESPRDPHVLNDFEDPVFDECNTAIAGIRHGGKARKGDGNEITPNPRKLFMIGHQLMRLNRQINACQLGADVPAAKRNESRKEKNKLASRACRLKKKAQHEANKIKLYGLEQQHSQLNSVLRYVWPHIRDRAKILLGQGDKSALLSSSTSLSSLLEARSNQNLKTNIAGHTADYVNSVILKVESGDNSGGLHIKKSHKT